MVLSSLYTWWRCILTTLSASVRQLLSLCSYKSGGHCGSERASNLPQVIQLASGGPDIWTRAYVNLAACSMPCWFAPRAHWVHASVLAECAQSLSHVWLFVTPWPIALQALLLFCLQLPFSSSTLFPLCLSLRKSSVFQKRPWEFPGSPVARTLCMRAKGLRSIPGWGTKIPEAMQCGQKMNKEDKMDS